MSHHIVNTGREWEWKVGGGPSISSTSIIINMLETSTTAATSNLFQLSIVRSTRKWYFHGRHLPPQRLDMVGGRGQRRVFAAELERNGKIQHNQNAAAKVALELLEWPRLCRVVASFAGTPSAKKLLQESTLPCAQGESENLLSKTTAAIEMLAVLGSTLDFEGLQTKVVNSCLNRLERGFVIDGQEAVAVAILLQFSDSLQRDTKTLIEHNNDTNTIMKPIVDMIGIMVAHQEVLKAIWKVVDADGIVKDSASPDLQRARAQERMLEMRIQELLNNILREEGGNGCSMQEICSIEGRLCILVATDNQRKFPGLLLQSGKEGSTSYIEPVAAVSLNDRLAEARASVLKAEYEAFLALTNKVLPHLDKIRLILDMVIQLDVVVARAKYSLFYEGTRPIFTLPKEGGSDILDVHNKTNEDFKELSQENRDKETLLQLRQAYHPLLLQQHRENLRNQKVRPYGSRKVAAAKIMSLMPIDVCVNKGTKVVTITGPNTGGKTAAMKTVGLAVLMAKSGLYVLAEDPVYLPWFDAVFADIGDEQSLCQSLSTFSGHLRRINCIKEESTGESLVLLDEVGTGTNPVEGAALGMSLLESFARDGSGGSLLTFASTHHAELKTLKYSDNRFENASVEFDEESLKPTYRLLWGIPGRSNALNISERLGVPKQILEVARTLHGVASAEINQVIMDLEKARQAFESNLIEAGQYLMKAKFLYRRLIEAMEGLQEQDMLLHLSASSIMHEEAHSARSAFSAISHKKQSAVRSISKHNGKTSEEAISTLKATDLHGGDTAPVVGETVYVPRLGKEVKVAQILSAKNEIVVQSGSIQFRLKFNEFY